MTGHQEEMCALHAMRALSPEEVRLLESESRYDARMRETLEEFEEAAAEIARLLPEETPPEDMRARILAGAKERARGNVTPFFNPIRLIRSPLIAWAAAAAIAIAAYNVWKSSHALRGEVAALKQSESTAQAKAEQEHAAKVVAEKQLADETAEVKRLNGIIQNDEANNKLARMEVAMLRSTIKRYEEGTAMVVWNQEKQEGLLKLENMPPVQPNKDYQLWVICKQCQHPVSAGVVKVNEQGVSTITFKPAQHIAQALKFAISVEAEGGVPVKPEGTPIVLVSR